MLRCLVFLPLILPLDAGLLDQLQWRSIGPFRGGRVVAVSGVAGDATTFYFGSVGGGVWKTTDGGTIWSPIFDGQHIASIGAIAVAPSDPNIVYVGTGETDIRSDSGFGDGVYRSTDAGKTWTNVGLGDSRQIARILIDPHNPNLIYVAALGHAYGPNAERGVFRSSDGGASWRKILDKGPEVGAVDLAFDLDSSRVIYATVWHGWRPPWSVYGPIEGSGGLYKSVDGGDHWTRVTGHGLPEGEWRRSGVATGRGRVYVLIDAAAGAGLYRSDDAGQTWTRTSADARITSRGWYFSGITVDPRDPDLVYIPNVALHRSSDGGKTFMALKGAPGGDDYHTLWIDPTEPRRMILGSDQGTNVSVDRGATWSTWYNQPTAQIYHVITDNRFPYSVYGAQQDSGTAAVASRTDHGGIDARDWSTVGGAESGYIAIDSKDANIFYVGDTNGSLTRFDRRTAQAQNITPGAGTRKYRFPWTAPLVSSSIEPGVVYYGSQYLLRTTDGGLSWREISPDLTGESRKDQSAAVTTENAKELGYGVLWSIAPSPRVAGLIWVGSDTGLIHVTRDEGKTWSNVTPKGLPQWSNVTHIEASHFDPATAYAAVDRHTRDDLKPYIYRTRDYGKTWTPVTEGLAEPAYLNAIREDPKRKGLLYAATEQGVRVSFDDGDHWQTMQLNLPVCSVRDLVVHDNDLVIATHGRGFWILDNMSPMREIGEGTVNEDVVLFRPAIAVRMNPEGFQGTPFPVEEPKSKNPPDGGAIDYYFKSAPEGEVTLEILKGNLVVRKYSSQDPVPAAEGAQNIADVWIVPPAHLTAYAGMNRFAWDLRYGMRGGGMGPHAVPGAYVVRLTAGGHSYTQTLKVIADPRSVATPLELSKQLELGLSMAKAIGKAVDAEEEIRTFRRQLVERRSAAAATSDAELVSRIIALDSEAVKIAGAGVGRGGRRGGTASAEPGLASVISELGNALSIGESADRTPPVTANSLFEQANRELNELLVSWKGLKAKAADLIGAAAR